MAQPFVRFIEEAEVIVRRRLNPAETVTAIEPLLRELLRDQTWLEEKYRRSIPQKDYAQYLLYRPGDHAFSVVSFVWNPSRGSPIHDHRTWGVIGQYVGVEEESRFRALPNGPLERIGVVSAKPGDVSHVYPPNRDLHQIMNRTSTPTISIHIYGGDIGSQERYAYDPLTGACRVFISGYDTAYDNV